MKSKLTILLKKYIHVSSSGIDYLRLARIVLLANTTRLNGTDRLIARRVLRSITHLTQLSQTIKNHCMNAHNI